MADEEARVELSEKLEETRKESEARGSRFPSSRLS